MGGIPAIIMAKWIKCPHCESEMTSHNEESLQVFYTNHQTICGLKMKFSTLVCDSSC